MFLVRNEKYGTLSVYVTRFPYETYKSTWPGFRRFRSGKSKFSNRWFSKWNFVECKVETVSLRFATLAFDVALACQCECHLDRIAVNWMEVTKNIMVNSWACIYMNTWPYYIIWQPCQRAIWQPYLTNIAFTV